MSGVGGIHLVFQCNDCGRRFDWRKLLDRHLRDSRRCHSWSMVTANAAESN